MEKPQRPILLIDDEPMNQLLVHDYLLAFGYQVIVASSAEEGMVLIGETRPAMVLLDLTLPGMDGLEAAKRIRRTPASARLPIVVLSGVASEECILRCLEAGCNAYLAKPFPLDELLSLVKTYTGNGETA